MSRMRVLGLLASAVAVVVVALLMSGGGESKRTAGACPAGQRVVSENGEGESSVLIGGGHSERERDKGGKARADKGEAGDYESHFRGRCAPVSHPESSHDLAKFNEYASTRQGADSPGAMSKALRQRDRLAQGAAAANIPGTGGTWTPYGTAR